MTYEYMYIIIWTYYISQLRYLESLTKEMNVYRQNEPNLKK